MNDTQAVYSAMEMVKQKMPSAIILDAAIVNDGVVVFSVDNQPLLCKGNAVRGLNGNVPEDAKIIDEAERNAGYKAVIAE